MKIHTLGEFNVIRRIQRQITPAKKNRNSLVVGVGDDAFVARLRKGYVLAATNDMLVEQIHFKREWATPEDIGYKAMAVNISDLAAMGRCSPLYGLVGLGLPGDIDAGFVSGLYRGMNAVSSKYGLIIAGGDTVSSKKDILISITVLGEIREKDVITRSGARPGDALLVTGTLGDSGAGLYLLEKAVRKGPSHVDYLLRRHRRPEPRVREAFKLSGSGKLTSMIDCSDGLAASARFLSESSGVGVRIDLESIPVSKALVTLAVQDRGVDPVQLALSGGEDYELIFTAPAKDVPALMKILPGITRVGEIVPGNKVTYYCHGKAQKINTTGYEHFVS